METRFALSIDATLRRVYAISALRSYLNHRREEIPMLTPDNRRGLALLAVDAFAEMAMRLMPKVKDIEMPEDETDDIMSLTMEVVSSRDHLPGAGALLMEECVAYATLAAAVRDVNESLAEQYERKSRATERAIASLIDPDGGTSHRLQPNY